MTDIAKRPLRKRVTRRVYSTYERLKTSLLTLGASVHPHPLFIMGNQKSGTTAIAALLAELSGLPVTLDLKKEMKEPSIDRVKSGRLSFEQFVHSNRLDFSRDIIKEPSLTLFYDEIAAMFPQSRFVMVVRDPRENIRSILQRLDIAGNLSNVSSDAIQRMPRAWQLVLDGRWLGLTGHNYIEMLALRWNLTTELYLRHEDRTTLCRFEDFLADKVGEIKRLAGVLDLAERADISSKVDIQFQPAGDRSVKWHAFFGAENLRRIEAICDPGMSRFSYHASP